MASHSKQHVFQAPKGTRDWYPLEAARRRYITEVWRSASIRHGYEEIDGPTFEHLDLFTVKSGDEIASQLFSFRRAGGDKDLALRPEFTPTLARMYAAKANSLAKPTKWFSIGPTFRAERPQRGRLREFIQWNVDHVGDDSPEADAEVIACLAGFLEACGLDRDTVRIHVNDRWYLTELLLGFDIQHDDIPTALRVLDAYHKLKPGELAEYAKKEGVGTEPFLNFLRSPLRPLGITSDSQDLAGFEDYYGRFSDLRCELDKRGVADWCVVDITIARGLAYYTGTVFEVIAEGERAIAGGGRYDNLIELFGGPPTPAIGFGMGDVVLSLLLQDKGLMPSDDELMEAAGQRPDVMVIPVGDETADLVQPTLARIRHQGFHARQTYKATRNVGKLLKDAANQNARLAVLLESPEECSIKNLDNGEQSRVPRDRLLDTIDELLGKASGIRQ